MRRWSASDPVLHAIAKETPDPWKALEDVSAFEALLQSIAHQQVSIQAGRSIFSRIQQLGSTPEAILKAGPEKLRAAGLSRPKVAYALDLAQKAVTKEVDLARISEMPDDEVVAELTKIKGIGVWTAKMFLLFHLQRPDVLPHEDLGLQVAVAKFYKVPRAKAAAKMQRLQPAWSPYCSYASLLLWNARRVDKGVEPR